MPSAIIVVSPGEAVSFETDSGGKKENGDDKKGPHFPVYLRNSDYNTNPHFDDGIFDALKAKIVGSGPPISSFAYTFTNEGVYVFRDYSDPAS